MGGSKKKWVWIIEYESWVEPEYLDSKTHLKWVKQLNTNQVGEFFSDYNS